MKYCTNCQWQKQKLGIRRKSDQKSKELRRKAFRKQKAANEQMPLWLRNSGE